MQKQRTAVFEKRLSSLYFTASSSFLAERNFREFFKVEIDVSTLFDIANLIQKEYHAIEDSGAMFCKQQTLE